jgi:hypothetical protein
LHYEVENKLLALIESLEAKRGTGEWIEKLPTTSNAKTLLNPTVASSGHARVAKLPEIERNERAGAGRNRQSSNPIIH